MAKQTVGLGSAANDGTGDDLRAGGTKINANFTDLYSDEGLEGNRTVMSAVPGSYNGSALITSNMIVPTTIGTAANGTLAATNERTRRKRVRFSSAASANSSGGIRSTSAVGYRGDASGRGGFVCRMRFGLQTVPSGFRAFVGLIGAAAAPGATLDPSALTDMIGLGKDAADSAWSLMHNDSSGTAVKETTVAAINIAANAVLEITLTCPAGSGQSISYEVKEVTGVDSSGNDTFGTPVTGTISTELPTTLTALFQHMYLNTGAGSTATDMDFLRLNAVTLGD